MLLYGTRDKNVEVMGEHTDIQENIRLRTNVFKEKFK